MLLRDRLHAFDNNAHMHQTLSDECIDTGGHRQLDVYNGHIVVSLHSSASGQSPVGYNGQLRNGTMTDTVVDTPGDAAVWL